ncbi:hypothetical protein [Parabacteroides sp. PFB2-10]|uniref:hypothetical protein n=1 Tax=Parabacteroides sp. PFB2-10 TaxID=1742405 RepID=UPI00247550C1|nr:hypothetical protein [Parabacteroides sp. PFB2-10]
MKRGYLFLLGWMLSISILSAQKSSFRYSGQLSGWGLYAPDYASDVWLGGRYLPQFNGQYRLDENRLFDVEISANLFGDMSLRFDEDRMTGDIKPYRAWARYSTSQLEIRAGLQKINFGSAMMFRPLMWFDKMDPRDPLQLTDGMWAGLLRYYFLNNANLWFWVLMGNKDIKGWESVPTNRKQPEAGGRFQWPVSQGEMAVSYHFRPVDFGASSAYSSLLSDRSVAEHRIGFDTKLNLTVGLWLEASWTHLAKDAGIMTNQTLITLGTDYTFPWGNGLTATLEQVVFDGSRQAFSFDNTATFSGLSLSYPIGIFDNLQGMVYVDWANHEAYNFLNWQRQYNSLTFYLMAYWNPARFSIPGMTSADNRFMGKGMQLMVVWNH